MAKVLRLNTAKVKEDYARFMSEALDGLLEQYYREVESGMHTQGGRSDLKTERLNDDERGMLLRRLIGGPLAVMDSWGTGSKMDTSNPALNEYLNSSFYNPARPKIPGAPITGRPEGEYTNMFGDTVYSSGALEGRNLENIPGSPITARSPSGAFQNADKWFAASKTVQEAAGKATTQFIQHMRKNAASYWRFG